MKVGQLLGTPLGEPIIYLKVYNYSYDPGLLRIKWYTKTGGPCFYQIWVNGVLYKTLPKNKRDVYVSINNAEVNNFIELITVGAYNADEDCYHLLQNEYGNKALIKWDSLPGVKQYKIYSDDGDGSIDWTTPEATILDTRKSDQDVLQHSWKTGGLVSGSYKYAIRGVDYYGGESSEAAEIPFTITSYPLGVSGLDYIYDGTNKELTVIWEKPKDSSWTRARIYDNGGRGAIDWDIMSAQSDSGATSITMAFPYDYGDWEVGVRSYSDISSLESSGMDNVIAFSITSGYKIIPWVYYAYALRATGCSGNYVKLSWEFYDCLERSQGGGPNALPIDYIKTQTAYIETDPNSIWYGYERTLPYKVQKELAASFGIWGPELNRIDFNNTSPVAYVDRDDFYQQTISSSKYYWVTPNSCTAGTYYFGIQTFSSNYNASFVEPRTITTFVPGSIPSMITGITVYISE